MAITAGTSFTVNVARWTIEDINQKKFNYTALFSATVTPAGFTTFLTSFAALTNAIISAAEIVSEVHTPYSGFPAVVGTGAQNSVLQQIDVRLQAANPLNATRLITELFPIPAFVEGVATSGHPPVLNSVNADVITVVNFLVANLGFRYSGDSNYYTPAGVPPVVWSHKYQIDPPAFGTEGIDSGV